jgi:hypothetical protein
MFKVKGNPRVLIGDIIESVDAPDPADGTAVVNLVMNGAAVTIDFTGAWNTEGYAYGDVAANDYVLSYQTGETSDVAAAEWMFVPAEVFEKYYIVEGA